MMAEHTGRGGDDGVAAVGMRVWLSHVGEVERVLMAHMLGVGIEYRDTVKGVP